ncbi:MAG TPA: FxsB family cyclophane-forming radical SAM/SPASM peptide maturase [Mycobacteriales bacterium]|nr:FxsB family cyclophane-forming radical SAM/SPASM peptide maturase [Mycobacteriales bacterium]
MTDDAAAGHTSAESGSWQPAPIRQFVLKVYSRCNLACDYCYVYRMADQSWQDRPLAMSRDVVQLAADRIAEHAHTHRLPRVGVVLHGGEPLLAGPAFFAETARTLRQRIPAATAVRLTVQSNGTLITEPLLNVLAEHGIRVAVSLDGGQAAQDRHRRYPNGRGSHADVARGLELLRSDPYRHLFAGLLCTVDLAHDPVTTYRDLLRFAPPRMDFLLPLGNWTAPPPGRSGDPTGTPYADWLGAVFDQWYSAPEQETELRLFREIIHLLLGGVSHLEGLGLAAASIAVLETDGSLEQVDALKSTFSGAAATGLHLATHAIDQLLRHPAFLDRQSGIAGLAEECRQCAVLEVCGGGFYPHRYRAGAGFRNRSVYCPDMLALIQRIRAQVAQDIGRLARMAS